MENNVIRISFIQVAKTERASSPMPSEPYSNIVSNNSNIVPINKLKKRHSDGNMYLADEQLDLQRVIECHEAYIFPRDDQLNYICVFQGIVLCRTASLHISEIYIYFVVIYLFRNRSKLDNYSFQITIRHELTIVLTIISRMYKANSQRVG